MSHPTWMVGNGTNGCWLKVEGVVFGYVLHYVLKVFLKKTIKKLFLFFMLNYFFGVLKLFSCADVKNNF